MKIPRTLLLTWHPPTLRFAGGEAVRKLLSVLPTDRLQWASLSDCMCEVGAGLPLHKAFRPWPWHWRLEGNLVGSLWRYEWMAKRRACRIAAWTETFRPEVIWTLPELDAINVAWHLRLLLRVPLHLMLHDAHECACFGGVPPKYLATYLERAKRLFGVARSFDAVSQELLDHAGRYHGNISEKNSLVLRPSVRHEDLPAAGCTFAQSGRKIRICVCGSLRISPQQWGDFLCALGRAADAAEIVIVTDRDTFHWDVAPPGNVTIAPRAYFNSERELIAFFRSARLSACYLGLWHERERRLFTSTSLSSKLCAYAALAVPVIVDAPEASVAWRLVSRYDAGIRLGPDGQMDEALKLLFSHGDRWSAMADGASRLCREEFDLDCNAVRFAALLRKTAAR